MGFSRILATFCTVAALVGCATVRDDLGRAENGYDAARYENAQVWLEEVEPDVALLAGRDRARFYYLRGMTALRLDDRGGALHYLSLAREEMTDAGGGLREAWVEVLGPTLESLVPATATHVPRAAE